MKPHVATRLPPPAVEQDARAPSGEAQAEAGIMRLRTYSREVGVGAGVHRSWGGADVRPAQRGAEN